MNKFNYIFVGGCDRSGTTMVAALLARLENIYAIPESQFLREISLKFYLKKTVSKAELANMLNSDFRFHSWGLSKKNKEKLIKEIPTNNASQCIEYLISSYLNDKGFEPKAGDYIIEHSPDNCIFYPNYRETLKNSNFIHILRDPRAVYLSFKNLDWGPGTPIYTAKFWSEKVRKSLDIEIAYPNESSRLIYEEIVSSEDGINYIIKELEKSNKALAEIIKNRNITNSKILLPEFTKKQHVLVGKKLEKDKTVKWKEELSKNEILLIESFDECSSIMDDLGYERKFNQKKLSKLDLAKDHIANFYISSKRYLKFKKIEEKVRSSNG